MCYKSPIRDIINRKVTVITIKTIKINKNDAGQRADKFITKMFPQLPQSMMYKAFRQKDIKIGGKRCDISTRLCEGDILTIYIKDELLEERKEREFQYDFLRASSTLDVAYEDENILIADKKPGLIVHQDESYQTDTLIARIQRYLYEKGEYSPDSEQSFAPALVNRIDRNTGGLVIAAKNSASLRILNEKMKTRQIHKTYLCIVCGKLAKKEDTLTGYLEKNESQNRVYIDKKPGKNSKTIITKYRVIAEQPKHSLLEVELLTGRTHQIRAHLASIGHPLLGDGKYGTNKNNRGTGFSKQALYSCKLIFDFTSDADILNYLNGLEVKAAKVPFAESFMSSSETRIL